MEIFIKILQGSYAYLLIFQILVVALLLLALIWLIAKRTRSAEEAGRAASERAPQPTAALSDAELVALKGQLGEAMAENERLRAEKNESAELKEKVKYLESKLLEYEILQEEIGTLTALKLENEHLKQELAQRQSLRAVAPPVVPEPAPAFSQAAPEPSLGLEGLSEIPGVLVSAPPAPDGASPAPVADDPTAGLEGLLKQIDELTSTPK